MFFGGLFFKMQTFNEVRTTAVVMQLRLIGMCNDDIATAIAMLWLAIATRTI